MVQIEKNENGIVKAFDLFDGMNVHPIPLDFSNSMTTTEFLLNLQNKINELIALWNESYEKLEELTETQKTEILNTIETKLINIQKDYKNIINNINNTLSTKIAEEKAQREYEDNKLKEELQEQINNIDTILNLISSDGQTISLSELYNNYSTINGKFVTLEKNVNNYIEQFNTLKESVNSFTENMAICKFIEQEEMEIPDTLINDNVNSLAFTYSSAKIESLLFEIKTSITHITTIIDTIGNENADNRDSLHTIQKTVVNNINKIQDDIGKLESCVNNLKYANNKNADIMESHLQQLYNSTYDINSYLYKKFSDYASIISKPTLTNSFIKVE